MIESVHGSVRCHRTLVRDWFGRIHVVEIVRSAREDLRTIPASDAGCRIDSVVRGVVFVSKCCGQDNGFGGSWHPKIVAQLDLAALGHRRSRCSYLLLRAAGRQPSTSGGTPDSTGLTATPDHTLRETS